MPKAADLGDVLGLDTARRLLEIAAAGGHTLHLTGEQGDGNGLMARCLASLLPDDEADQPRALLVDLGSAQMFGRLEPLQVTDLSGPEPETSALVRARVLAARELQSRRQPGLNAQIKGRTLKRVAPLDSPTKHLLEAAQVQIHLNSRRMIDAMRIARTIADLDGRASISRFDLSEALNYMPRRPDLKRCPLCRGSLEHAK